MTIGEKLLPEFDHEMQTTRKLLELVPEENAGWTPHSKSMTLGALAIHIATIPSWVQPTLETTELDVNPPGGTPWVQPKYQTTAGMLEFFDGAVAQARAMIAQCPDAELFVTWTLRNNGAAMFSMPRVAVLRSFIMNHLIHHRGQLSVYLRLLDKPLPSIYGPTADTPA